MARQVTGGDGSVAVHHRGKGIVVRLARLLGGQSDANSRYYRVLNRYSHPTLLIAVQYASRQLLYGQRFGKH